MKRLIKYILNPGASFIIVFVLQASFLIAQDCKSVVEINTNDPASLIFLNQKLAGTGKITAELPEGIYILQIRENNIQWEYSILQDSIIIDSCGEKLEFNYNLSKKMYLSTIPADAQVYTGDSLLGFSPLFIPSTITSVKIEKSNFEPVILNLENMRDQLKINLKEMNRNNNPTFFKTNLFRILLGSALVLGGTAAYFKLQADNNFEKYNLTKDNSFKNKTDQYDLISGIAFGMLQVDFGIMIYHFLTD